MLSLSLFQTNMTSPMVLAFFLGFFAMVFKSDLKLPEGLYAGLSMYLLIALGLKGGLSLSHTTPGDIIAPMMATLALGMIIPIIAFFGAKTFGKLHISDAAAMAAHYGSVSVVTFMASLSFMEILHPNNGAEPFMVALVTVMEVPGIIVALLLASRAMDKRKTIPQQIKSIVTGKSIFLLLGGMLIGYLTGDAGMTSVKPFFIDPFKGVLVLFMLDMGVLAGSRFKDIKKAGIFLIAFAVTMPVMSACMAIVFGHMAGLSLAGSTVLAAMAASASYIAAPAAVRTALPAANPGLYLTSSIAITFPFNLTLGIPIYYMLASWYYS